MTLQGKIASVENVGSPDVLLVTVSVYYTMIGQRRSDSIRLPMFRVDPVTKAEAAKWPPAVGDSCTMELHHGANAHEE